MDRLVYRCCKAAEKVQAGLFILRLVFHALNFYVQCTTLTLVLAQFLGNSGYWQYWEIYLFYDNENTLFIIGYALFKVRGLFRI